MTPTALSVGRSSFTGTSVGNHILFAGGDKSRVVDAYDLELTRNTPTQLDGGGRDNASASIGGYALFAGGVNTFYFDKVEGYTSDLVHISLSHPDAAAKQGEVNQGYAQGNDQQNVYHFHLLSAASPGGFLYVRDFGSGALSCVMMRAALSAIPSP